MLELINDYCYIDLSKVTKIFKNTAHGVVYVICDNEKYCSKFGLDETARRVNDRIKNPI